MGPGQSRCRWRYLQCIDIKSQHSKDALSLTLKTIRNGRVGRCCGVVGSIQILPVLIAGTLVRWICRYTPYVSSNRVCYETFNLLGVLNDRSSEYEMRALQTESDWTISRLESAELAQNHPW